MKKAFKFKLLLIILLTTISSSCKKDNINDFTEEEHQRQTFYNPSSGSRSTSYGATILGIKLQNPYSVANMQEAYSNLQQEDPNFPSISISTNYRYIKFMPQDEAQLDLLKSDTTIILYDIPLDYEIAVNGTYYHDPSLPDSAVTYQYCSLPINKTIPDVPYSILENLYIPPIEQDFSSARSTMNQYYEALVDEALRITDNLNSNERTISSYWTPAGTIKMIDNILGEIPIAGIKVRARRWFTTYEGITNNQGYFECNGQFKGDANYSFNWERYHFSIRSGEFGQAKYDGPKQTGNWNLSIDGGTPEFYAIIFRAAFHYYYGNVHNLRRPPLNEILGSQMKIAAKYEYNENLMGIHYGHWRFTIGIEPRIKIYNPQELPDAIYSATIHELAHAVHWNMNQELYNGYGLSSIEKIVKESWASGAQWYLTKMIYPNYTNNNYIRCLYTGIVEDLIDGISTKTSNCYYSESTNSIYNSTLSYHDKTLGYTIKQIENSLLGVKTWSMWENYIKALYNNSTENYLGNAFNYWNKGTYQSPALPVPDGSDTILD